MKRTIAAVLAVGLLLSASPVLAWGTKGHTMINKIAATLLPAEMPAFTRSPAAVAEIGTLGPEEDRLKGAGKSWDTDNDNGHFLDIGDDNKIGGVVSLDNLPESFSAYDTALRAVGQTPYKDGYVPYNILDGWEQVRQDFAYWRVDNYEATHAASAADRAHFATDRTLREDLTLRDIGVWGHFVGDSSQPLHITIHFNGWGKYPNPNGYTEAPIHSMFESEFVNRVATYADVTALVPSYHPVDPATRLTGRDMLTLIGKYLADTAATVPTLYQIEKAGGFTNASPEAVKFVDRQLAHGAREMRDLTALAWEDSLNDGVGYPTVSVRDILAGRADFSYHGFGDD